MRKFSIRVASARQFREDTEFILSLNYLQLRHYCSKTADELAATAYFVNDAAILMDHFPEAALAVGDIFSTSIGRFRYKKGPYQKQRLIGDVSFCTTFGKTARLYVYRFRSADDTICALYGVPKLFLGYTQTFSPKKYLRAQPRGEHQAPGEHQARHPDFKLGPA